MLHVIATIECQPGKRHDFLKEFHAVMPKVLKEDGCIEYGPTVDATTSIPVQIARRDNTVTVVEKWRDLPALEAHLKAPHMIEYRTRIKDFVAGVKLQVLEPA
jgi:quinol monooxygenase YgiN